MISKWHRFSRWISIAAAVGVISVAVPASAAFVDGLVGQVEYPKYLMVQLSGINYEAQLSSVNGSQGGSSCSIASNSIDTLKIWQTLAQGALLAGKQVRVYYSQCNNRNWISDIVLKQ